MRYSVILRISRWLCLLFILYRYVDRDLADYFSRDPFPAWLIQCYRCVDTLGEPQWYLIPLGLLGWCVRKIRVEVSRSWLFIFTTVALAGVLANICKWFLGRVRPSMYLAHNVYGFYPHWSEYNAHHMSFPSGHSTVVFAFAFACIHVYPRARVPVFVYAICVASSRVVLGYHFLSDVVAGAIAAYVMTWVWWYYTGSQPGAGVFLDKRV